MQPPDGADALPDICNAPDTFKRVRSAALLACFCNQDDLIS